MYKIKQKPEDFVVREIINADAVSQQRQLQSLSISPSATKVAAGKHLADDLQTRYLRRYADSGNYIYFWLWKRNYTTIRALEHIGKAVGVGMKRFGNILSRFQEER